MQAASGQDESRNEKVSKIDLQIAEDNKEAEAAA